MQVMCMKGESDWRWVQLQDGISAEAGEVAGGRNRGTAMIGCRKRGIQGVCIYRRDALMSLRFRARYNADVIEMSTEVKNVVELSQ
jgi:hypothetical protein